MTSAAHETRLAVAVQDDAGHWHAHGSQHYPDTAEGRAAAREHARFRRIEIGTRGYTRAGCCGCACREVSVVPVRYDERAFRYVIDFDRWNPPPAVCRIEER